MNIQSYYYIKIKNFYSIKYNYTVNEAYIKDKK